MLKLFRWTDCLRDFTECRNSPHSMCSSHPCVRYTLDLLFSILECCVIFPENVWAGTYSSLIRHTAETKDTIPTNSRLIIQWEYWVTYKNISEGWLTRAEVTERQLAEWPKCPHQQGSNDIIDSILFHHPEFLQDLQAAPPQSFLSDKYLLVVHLWEGPPELPGPL